MLRRENLHILQIKRVIHPVVLRQIRLIPLLNNHQLISFTYIMEKSKDDEINLPATSPIDKHDGAKNNTLKIIYIQYLILTPLFVGTKTTECGLTSLLWQKFRLCSVLKKEL